MKKVKDLVYIEEKTGPVRGNLPKELLSGVQIFPIKQTQTSNCFRGPELSHHASILLFFSKVSGKSVHAREWQARSFPFLAAFAGRTKKKREAARSTPPLEPMM